MIYCSSISNIEMNYISRKMSYNFPFQLRICVHNKLSQQYDVSKQETEVDYDEC